MRQLPFGTLALSELDNPGTTMTDQAMTENEHRHISRDSLFVMADLRIDGIEGHERVRVRNLSAGGMMAETPTLVRRGQTVWSKLRNIGWVQGSVAWVQRGRFGVAFSDEIDPAVVRAPTTVVDDPLVVRRPVLYTKGVGTLRNI